MTSPAEIARRLREADPLSRRVIAAAVFLTALTEAFIALRVARVTCWQWIFILAPGIALGLLCAALAGALCLFVWLRGYGDG